MFTLSTHQQRDHKERASNVQAPHPPPLNRGPHGASWRLILWPAAVWALKGSRTHPLGRVRSPRVRRSLSFHSCSEHKAPWPFHGEHWLSRRTNFFILLPPEQQLMSARKGESYRDDSPGPACCELSCLPSVQAARLLIKCLISDRGRHQRAGFLRLCAMRIKRALTELWVGPF